MTAWGRRKSSMLMGTLLGLTSRSTWKLHASLASAGFYQAWQAVGLDAGRQV